MKAKKEARILIAAEWLRPSDDDWWFFSKVLKLNPGDMRPVLLGNGRLYNEKDRQSLPGHLLYILKTLWFALRLCFVCRRTDVLFTWNQLVALIPAAVFRLCRKSKPVVCQNFLYRPSASAAVDACRRLFYNYALGYRKFYLSVQSEELLHHYKKQGITLPPERCYAVKDCLPENRVPQRWVQAAVPDGANEGYVFTGGEANRNWKTVMDIARQLPDQAFVAVARKRFFDTRLAVPSNVTMHWDTTLEEYFALVAKSKMTLIAVKDELNPAGLLLLFDSIVLGKPVVATQTPFIAPYLGPCKSELSFTTATEAVQKIQRLQNASMAAEACRVLRRNLAEADSTTFVNVHLHQIYHVRVAN